MTQRTVGSRLAALPNVASFVEMIMILEGRSRSLPGLGVVYGPAGYGKSVSAMYVTHKFSAYFVEIKDCWTKKKVCSAMLETMGLQARGTVADMVDMIGRNLAETGKTLIIDEARYLVNKNMTNLILDIYQSSFAPIVLIGEEDMPGILSENDRLHGRILEWVGFEKATMTDLELLAEVYCPKIELSDDIKSAIYEASRYSVRRISNNLNTVNMKAKNQGLSTFTLEDWGDSDFYTGISPKRKGYRA